MTDGPANSSQTQRLLDRLAAGDDKAADELIEYAMDRLRRLVRKQLQNNPRVHRWEVTDDVLQNSLMRLHRALKSVKPATTRDFINLAATQIRRELCDLARHHFGPEGVAGHQLSGANVNDTGSEIKPRHELEPDGATGPATAIQRTEFHEQVNRLPDDEREVFGLIFYLNLEQDEVAKRLGISVPTVKRRWRSAKLLLVDAMGGEDWLT